MGRTYDPFLKNCNNFTKHFLKLILFNNINYPAYINRICKFGHVFSSFYPPIKRLYGNLHQRDTCGSVSHLAQEINYFLKKNNENTSRHSNNIIENEIDVYKEPIDFDNLKEDEKYFSEKEKCKKKKNNESSSLQESLNNSSLDLVDEVTISRLNKYCPQLIRYMNKDPYLYPLDYSSIYKTQVQGKQQIDINIESLHNFFKNLQDVNDKLVTIFNINPNINSLLKINNFIKNQKCQINEYNISDYNKLNEDIYLCDYKLEIIIKDKIFHNKNIKINYNTFIKDNIHLFPDNLILDNKLIDIERFLRLKLLHMKNFVHFVSKNFERQKDSVENILLINQNDFYGLLSLSYIRLIQSNLPECSELINSLSNRKDIMKVPLYSYALNQMENIIKNIIGENN
jgi:hypothetical protein